MRRISLSRHPIEEQSEKYWIEGDLRLMVKTNPVAFIIAQAAGAASASWIFNPRHCTSAWAW